MELRTLEYFLAVASEQNISRAAEFLHLSQPTLSRQLMNLEEEFGCRLFIRGKRKITLTEDGILFRKMAQEITDLARKAEAEMKNPAHILAGDIYIGSGESASVARIVECAASLQKEYPDVHFHFTSGDSQDLEDRLDKGLFDFCILFGDIDHSRYEYIDLPYKERWCLLIRKDDPLAERDTISTSDLQNIPLILSRRSSQYSNFFNWLGEDPKKLNIVATYNLSYIAGQMAQAGMGYVITLETLINTEGTELCSKEIEPPLYLNLHLVWKKHRPISRAATMFIEAIRSYTDNDRS